MDNGIPMCNSDFSEQLDKIIMTILYYKENNFRPISYDHFSSLFDEDVRMEYYKEIAKDFADFPGLFENPTFIKALN